MKSTRMSKISSREVICILATNSRLLLYLNIKSETGTSALAYYDGDVIVPPGHYELALSHDMNFLLIMQSKRILVKIPAFKVDYEMEDTQAYYEGKIKTPKWFEFRKKRLIKKKKDKLVRSGMNPENEKFLYQNVFSLETIAGYEFEINDKAHVFIEMDFNFHLLGDGFVSVKPCLGASFNIFKERR